MLVIGLISGIITGLLSVGGGIILIFFLLVLPPILLQSYFPMQTIAAFSIMQAFFATLSGAFYYIREKLIDLEIVLYLGVPAFFGGILGVMIAHSITDFALRVVFAILAATAAVVMFIPNRSNIEGPFKFTAISYVLSGAGGILIGVIGGMVGLSAGFIFVPVMIYLYRLSVKKAIGTSLATCFLLAAGSFLAKLGAGAVSIEMGVALVAGGVIGAQIGGRIGKRLPSLVLKRTAAFSIFLISIKVVYDLF